MIRFQLRCERGDSFEAWFRSNSDFAGQRRGAQLSCPFCGSTAIEKDLMAPSVLSGDRPSPSEGVSPTSNAVTPPTPAAPLRVSNGNPELAKAIDMMRELSRQVRANSDYVGPCFAEEARKIHYAEVPARSIYGEATPSEVRELAEEGVGFQPLPVLPEELN
jgi:hypothetical protein